MSRAETPARADVNGDGLNYDPGEAEAFDRLASRWWDPEGDSRPLHDLNGPRVDWIAGQAGLDGARLADIGYRHPAVVLLTTLALLLGSLFLGQWLSRDFFPSTDRNQLLVDMTFPEGTHTDHSALMANGLAAHLRERDDVEAVHVYAGFSGPRFFYNLAQIPASPHFARLVLPELVAGVPIRFVSLMAVSYGSVLTLALLFTAPATFLEGDAVYVAGTTLKAISVGAVFSVVGAATADSVF